MRRHRADGNQTPIVAILRELGATVFDLSKVGFGCPDKLVGIFGATYLVEIKNPIPFGWKYTPAQNDFRDHWKGGALVTLESVEQAIQWVQSLNKRREKLIDVERSNAKTLGRVGAHH